jgi:hypothetical protein
MSEQEEEHPPLLKTWRRVYALVIAVQIILIISLYFFTRYFK